jgi:hypothetical protein
MRLNGVRQRVGLNRVYELKGSRTVMGLNFPKNNDSDYEKFFGATKWSQFEYEKTTLKRAIKVDLLLIFCCYYIDRVTKTQRIRTESVQWVQKIPTHY